MAGFLSGIESQGINVTKSIGSGLTAAGADMILFEGTAKNSLKDGGILAASDFGAQFLNIASFVPLPSSIGHLANAVAAGAAYSAVNNYALTDSVSPFKNVLGSFIYGSLCAFVSEAAVDPLLSDL